MQTRELCEGDEKSWGPFEAVQQSAIVAEPGEGPLDLPGLAIALEHTAIHRNFRLWPGAAT